MANGSERARSRLATYPGYRVDTTHLGHGSISPKANHNLPTSRGFGKLVHVVI